MSWLECPICYGKFKKSGNSYVKYCPDCRKNRKGEIEQYTKEQKAMENLKKSKSNQLTPEFLNEIEEYNETHGTNLSYGKYVAMKDGVGKLWR